MVQFRSAYTARVISIYERALRKFKSQLHVWTTYISWAKERGMRVVLGRVLARVLAMHPTKVELWAMAADQELNSNGSATGARSLLQRGLRINKPAAPSSTRKGKERQKDDGSDRPHKKSRMSDSGNRYALATASTSQERLPPPLCIPPISESQERSYLSLALEYVRMELIFMERLRRRWAILGIDAEGAGADKAMAAAEQAEQGGEDGDQEEAQEEDEEMQEQAIDAAQMPFEDEGGDAQATTTATADNSVTAAQKRAEESRASAAAQLPVLQGAIARLAIRSAVDAIQLPKEGDLGSSKAAHSAALGYRLAFLLAVRRLLYAFPFVDGHVRKGSGQKLRDSLVAEVTSLLKSAVGEASTGLSEGSAEIAFLHSADAALVSKLPLWATSAEAADELESGEGLKDASRLAQRKEGNELDEILAYHALVIAGESQDRGPAFATNRLLIQQIMQAVDARLQREDAALPTDFVQAFKHMALWQETLLSDCEGKHEKRLARIQASRLAGLQSLLLSAVREKAEEDGPESDEGAEPGNSQIGSLPGFAQLIDALQSQIFDTAKQQKFLNYEIAVAHLSSMREGSEDALRSAKKVKHAIEACRKTEEAIGGDGNHGGQGQGRAELWGIYLDALEDSLEDDDGQENGDDARSRDDALLGEHLAALSANPEALSLWERTIAHTSQAFARRNKNADKWAWSALEAIVDRSSHLLQTCSDSNKREQRQRVHDSVLIAILDIAQDLRETRSEKTAAQAVERSQSILINDSCASPAFWLQYVDRALQQYRLLKKDASIGEHVLSDEKKKARQISSRAALQSSAQQIDQIFQNILLITAQDAGTFVEARRQWLKHLLQDRGAVPKAIAAFEACRKDAMALSPLALRQIEKAWESLSSGLGGEEEEEESEEEE